MNTTNVCFRLGEDLVIDNSWKDPQILPRINESVCLGKEGKYFWYTIKAINWVSCGNVVFVLTNKRETVEV